MVKRYYHALCNRRTLDFIVKCKGAGKAVNGLPPLRLIRCHNAGYYTLPKEATAAAVEAHGFAAVAVFKPFIKDGQVIVFRFTPQGDKTAVITFAGLPAE